MKYKTPCFILLVLVCLTASSCTHKRILKNDPTDLVSSRPDPLDLIDVSEKIIISDVDFAKSPPDMRHEQRVFGMITNNSNSSIRYITLNLVFKDQNKKIIDVISGEMYNELGGNGERISGILRPHQSKGFLVKRRIGMFNQPEIDFEGMKAHSVDVTINNFVIVPKTAE